MTFRRNGNSISRRTAITGLGAGGIGVAVAATTRHAVAQDATPPVATQHPLIGLWQNLTTGPGSDTMPWVFSIFHADGTYHAWNGLGAGSALGIWRSTGDGIGDLLFIYLDTDPTTATETPGTATFRMTAEVDETGDALLFAGGVDVRSPDGSLIVDLPDARWTATRVTFDHNPAMGSTAITLPAAGTPTA
jgi:hypothetical protein